MPSSASASSVRNRGGIADRLAAAAWCTSPDAELEECGSPSVAVAIALHEQFGVERDLFEPLGAIMGAAVGEVRDDTAQLCRELGHRHIRRRDDDLGEQR